MLKRLSDSWRNGPWEHSIVTLTRLPGSRGLESEQAQLSQALAQFEPFFRIEFQYVPNEIAFRCGATSGNWQYSQRAPARWRTAIRKVALMRLLGGNRKAQFQTRPELDEGQQFGSLDVGLVFLAFARGEFTLIGFSRQPVHP